MPRSKCGQGVRAPRSTHHEIPASSRTKPYLEEWQETGVAWINARSVMFAGSIGMTLMWAGLSLGWGDHVQRIHGLVPTKHKAKNIRERRVAAEPVVRASAPTLFPRAPVRTEPSRW
ncbi:hypothetical protein KIL84_021556 [Mauremys mutica]|uniref:Uncharacterized protein n=1 Tax=Mauremys mutica TaxID=74926 RepID=A0A9D3X911_9SAUR|nr:hypothetical protein KIL84_021556 [Mauremys mutica]